MGRRRAAIAVVVVLAVVAAACSSPPPSSTPPTPGPLPPLTPITLPNGGAQGSARATVAFAVVPHLGATPDGPPLLGDGRPFPIDAGTRVTILGDPTAGPGGEWVRIWVQPDEQHYPGDYFAWLPVELDGRATLDSMSRATCPAEATIDSIAPLGQQDRRVCAGALAVTLDARSGQLGRVPYYDVDPAWYGINAGPAIAALYDPGPTRVGPGAILDPGSAGAWLEFHVPPDVPSIPLGYYLRVTGQFDHPSAASCRRTNPTPDLTLGPPVEAAVDSVAWCRDQFVVTGWQALLGPEGRPIDPAAPQLHRREFVPPPGVVLACGGVGMPPLTIRIDPSQVDPVWVESGPRRTRSLAVFSNDFGIALDPPRIRASNGVTIVDGEVVDPDRGKPGLAVCPGGDTISFDAVPAR